LSLIGQFIFSVHPFPSFILLRLIQVICSGIYLYFLCCESIAVDGFSLFGSANRNQEYMWKTKQGL